MEIVPKRKRKAPRSNNVPVAAARKIPAKRSKAGTVRVKADKTKTKEATAAPVAVEITCEERHQLIAEAAYFRAERRNFVPGHELEDWLSAEAELELKRQKNAD